MHDRVIGRLASLPGVTGVAATSRLPLAAGTGSRTVADLHITGSAGSSAMRVSFVGLADVTPTYFQTIGIPLLRGRGFDANDSIGRERVIIVSERAARQLWPNEEALGQRVTWGAPGPGNPPATVVGIAGNVRAFAAEADNGLELYYPYAQYPAFNIFYVLRTSTDPRSLSQTVRRVIQDTEPSIAVSTIKSMPQRIEESLWHTRLWGWLFGLFAAVALLLAAAGLYGLVSYLVALRSKEIGIRLCVGATGEQIARLLLGGMFRLVIAGIVAGVLAALAASRLLSTLLFQVSPTDPWFYITVSVTVAAVTLLACCPPILRSRRTNVVSVLYED